MSLPTMVNKLVEFRSELWGFTVKILKDPVKANAESYEPFFRVLYQLSEVITYCGEIDSKGVLHYHGVIRLPVNFYRKNLRIKGYHLYLKRIYNLQRWIDYCFKSHNEYDFEKKWDSLQDKIQPKQK